MNIAVTTVLKPDADSLRRAREKAEDLRTAFMKEKRTCSICQKNMERKAFWFMERNQYSSGQKKELTGFIWGRQFFVF